MKQKTGTSTGRGLADSGGLGEGVFVDLDASACVAVLVQYGVGTMMALQRMERRRMGRRVAAVEGTKRKRNGSGTWIAFSPKFPHLCGSLCPLEYLLYYRGGVLVWYHPGEPHKKLGTWVFYASHLSSFYARRYCKLFVRCG